MENTSVHAQLSDKLAVAHSSCLFGAEYYSGQRERKSIWQGFQSKICELVSGKLSKCLYTAISRTVVGKNVHATIPKGNMGYDQYAVPDTVAVEPTFVTFLYHS